VSSETPSTPTALDPSARWKALAVFALVVIVGGGVVLEQTVFKVAGGNAKRYAPAVVFHDQQGKEVSLASFKGKVVVLNFWATWCPPCVQETPSFDHFAEIEAEKNPNLVILAASIDDDKWVSIDPFRKRLGVKHLNIVVDDTRAAERFGTYKLPETWIIGRDGELLPTDDGSSRYLGAVNWSNPKTVSYIEGL
jgi:thiol-disulfide isomerase/thioredoxin